MRVEIRLEPDAPEPYAILCVPEWNAEIQGLVQTLEQGAAPAGLVVAKRDDKLYVMEPARVELVRTEGGSLQLYDRECERYVVDGSLHEILEKLGRDFVRISKSAVVNMRRVDNVSTSFSGTMAVVMKNGLEDTISRTYLRDFKRRLGL